MSGFTPFALLRGRQRNLTYEDGIKEKEIMWAEICDVRLKCAT
jgi:hypothetical protein